MDRTVGYRNVQSLVNNTSLVHNSFFVCLFLFLTIWSSTQSDKYQVSYWYSYFSWWWAHSCPKHVENRNKHTKKELCTRLVLFTRLYKDAQSTQYKKWTQILVRNLKDQSVGQRSSRGEDNCHVIFICCYIFMFGVIVYIVWKRLTGDRRWNASFLLMSLSTTSTYTCMSSAYKWDNPCIALNWLEEFWVLWYTILILITAS
jgi:hypothetical protein